ncbi:MAG: pilus assembly protein N-terminal domain-containing protein [Pseudomonadota bacterium]
MTSSFASFPAALRSLRGTALTLIAAAAASSALADPLQPASSAVMPAAAYAAPLSESERAPTRRRSLLVIIDHLERVSFAAPVETVLVGNPAIADVTMISSREGVVSARAVGSTNIFFLDRAGRALGDFEVIVREGETRRMVLRRGPGRTELYQCAPRCERTLSQLDSEEAHQELSNVVTTENRMTLDSAAAVGAEGAN